MRHPAEWSGDQWKEATGHAVQIMDNKGEESVVVLHFPNYPPPADADDIIAIYLYGSNGEFSGDVSYEGNTYSRAEDGNVYMNVDSGNWGANYTRQDHQNPDAIPLTREIVGGADVVYEDFPNTHLDILGKTLTLEATEERGDTKVGIYV